MVPDNEVRLRALDEVHDAIGQVVLTMILIVRITRLPATIRTLLLGPLVVEVRLTTVTLTSSATVTGLPMVLQGETSRVDSIVAKLIATPEIVIPWTVAMNVHPALIPAPIARTVLLKS